MITHNTSLVVPSNPKWNVNITLSLAVLDASWIPLKAT